MGRFLNDQEWRAYVRELGDMLAHIRHERRMSQEHVAAAADITRYTYQRLEKGLGNGGQPANPTLRTLTCVAGALDVGIEDFLPSTDLPTRDESMEDEAEE